MQQKHSFFSPKPSNDIPVYIMLSGLPCTGKSTWRQKMLSRLNELRIPVTVHSADDLAFVIRDEMNQRHRHSPPLTYADILTTYRPMLENRFKEAVLQSRKQSGVIILDRTYLTTQKRSEVLTLIPSSEVHVLSFTIKNQEAWQENLNKRNDKEAEKKITPEIINYLNKDRSNPELAEGFASTSSCLAVGEVGWEESFNASIESLIALYQQHHSKSSLTLA